MLRSHRRRPPTTTAAVVDDDEDRTSEVKARVVRPDLLVIVPKNPSLLLVMNFASNDIVVAYGEGRASVQDFLNVCRTYQGDAPHFLFSEFNDSNEAVGRDEEGGEDDEEDYDEDEEEGDDDDDDDDDNDNDDDDDDDNDDEYWYDINLENEDFGENLIFYHCLRQVPEERLFELMEALVAEHPHVLTLTHDGGGSLLHLALEFPRHGRLQLLLAVPESTRLLDLRRWTPLHCACGTTGIDVQVIHRLMDLDPDVLTYPDRKLRVPLHVVPPWDLLGAHVRRMIELRPDSLLLRGHLGQTPVEKMVEYELHSAYRCHRRTALLTNLVAQHPLSVALPDKPLKKATVLSTACYSTVPNPRLVSSVLKAHPPASVIPGSVRWLPYQAATESKRPWNPLVGVLPVEQIKEVTAFMAFAVVEYVLGVSIPTLFMFGSDDTAANVGWFQKHIKDTLRDQFPDIQVEGASGLSVAQALLHTLDRYRYNPDTFAFISAVFCHERAVKLLWGERRLLRSVILSDTVVDLYHLNRQGRYSLPPELWVRGRPTPLDDDKYDSSVAAALDQVDLLASLKDSETVESTYLQFREVSYHSMLMLERQRRRCSRTSLPILSSVAS